MAIQTLVKQTLEAFERLQPAFEASFRFVQEVHGQRRFAAFPVAEMVHYLHALWICECKDRLLSVTRSSVRYEGRYCLDLLRYWQEGETAAEDIWNWCHLDTIPSFCTNLRAIYISHLMWNWCIQWGSRYRAVDRD